MLKITHDVSEESVTIKLEGKLLGPWVSEARSQVDRVAANGLRLGLDLLKVSFVDEGGVRLLRELLGRGVRITACSNFVAELLELEKK